MSRRRMGLFGDDVAEFGDPVGVEAAAVGLVGDGGEVEPVTDDGVAGVQGGGDDVVDVFGSGGEEEEGLRLGCDFCGAV